MSGVSPELRARIDAVAARVSIVKAIGGAVKLSRGRHPRGKCPFHGSSSDSFAVYPDAPHGGRARCWGCGWSGDALRFVQDYQGVDFMEALRRLESGAGLDAAAAVPVKREKQPARPFQPELVASGVVAKAIWDGAARNADSLRVWLRARRVPEPVLAEEWIGGLRFHPAAPVRPWLVNGSPGDVASAPAMVALIRRPVVEDDGSRRFRPIGVHVTYLSPGLRAKMNRKRADGTAMPARKVYGESGGGLVLLGRYRADCALFVGEGIETTLSGMGLLAMGEPQGCGLAVLGLDNLQGLPLLKKGALPLYDPRPDPARMPVCFAHDGPVTALVDADMAPLRGFVNRETGECRGVPVIERTGGPVVYRTLTSEERSRLCGALFTHAWRAAGCRPVRAERPDMGRDFNDEAAA